MKQIWILLSLLLSAALVFAALSGGPRKFTTDPCDTSARERTLLEWLVGDVENHDCNGDGETDKETPAGSCCASSEDGDCQLYYPTKGVSSDCRSMGLHSCDTDECSGESGSGGFGGSL